MTQWYFFLGVLSQGNTGILGLALVSRDLGCGPMCRKLAGHSWKGRVTTGLPEGPQDYGFGGVLREKEHYSFGLRVQHGG